MEGYGTSSYGDRFADVYDDWYGAVSDVQACTESLAALVAELGGGPVLELGIGSGRLALPLAARGVEVHGIDASKAMLESLRSKPGGADIHLTLGDMAELELPGKPRFSLVFVAFNTFFNLPTEEAQRRCLERVAAVLAPEGRFVLEAFVPEDADADADGPARGTDRSVVPRRITADEVVLSVTMVDRAAQTITGSHVQIAESGIRLRPWHLRYATPDELDRLAGQAGLVLEHRRGGWRGEPFTADSGLHVSTYRLGASG